MQNLSGQKLGNYELRERLGRGGMAEVYRAYQAGMDRDVAVKVMLGHLAEDDNFIERFKREARAVGRLRHPHIIDIFDFGIENDVYYMVMEYLTDGNLKEYIDKNGSLSLQESLKITRDLADALDYAHKSGMIHRDLKPANIMFMDKEKHNVVLTDFGIARILNATGLTGTGMSVGTPVYMSPEAGRGEETDERADIYALGIILYEMLVGEAPYNADTPLAVIMKHINAPLPTRDDYGDAIPTQVERIMLRCLAKEPDTRFSTAGELRDAINAIIDSTAQTDNRVPSVKPTQVSANNTVQEADTLPDMPTTAMNVSGIAATSKHDATPSSDKPQKSGSNVNLFIAAIIAIVVIGGLGFFLFDEFFAVSDEPTEAVVVQPTVEPVTVESVTVESVTIVPPVTFEPQLGGDLPPNPDVNLSVYSNISDILNEAETLVFAGDLEGAIIQVDDILANDPENLDALFARARLYSYRWDEANVAGDTAQQLIDLAPESAWGYIALADSYLNYPLLDEEGSVDAAREAIERAAELEPENPHVMWRLAALGDWELEFERYLRAEELGASGADFIRLIGLFWSANGDYRRAIPYWESYVAGTDSEPWNWSDGFWNLMEALIWSGEAQTAYDVLLDSDFPDSASDAATFSNMAFIAFMPGEYDQARTWANAALAFSTDEDANGAKWVLAYMTYEVDGDEDSAIEQLMQLAEDDAFYRFVQFSTGVDAHMQAGRYLVDTGREEDAIAYYDVAIELNGSLPFLYEERADAYLAIGETESARADLQSALALISEDTNLQSYYRDRIIELGPSVSD